MRQTTVPWTWGNRWIGYDRARRRVWICRQRVHHGAVALIGLVACIAACIHDWKDRRVWFARGMGELP